MYVAVKDWLRLNTRTVRRYLWRFLGRIWRNLAWLFRAIGLRSLNHIQKARKEPEEAKEVLQKSFWIAFSRCAVHLAPMLVFVLLLMVNYKTVFIGSGFSINDEYDAVYLALFQVAAKLQEIVCIASLSTILLQILRADLLHGDGTPLGLLSSHLWFPQPNSLLLPEYLSVAQGFIWDLMKLLFRRKRGSPLTYKDMAQQWRKLRLVLFISVLVILAVLIGPFSAVLMLPRSQSFLAGGTQYYINATVNEMWPNAVGADVEHEACTWSNATTYPVCPCGGYSALRSRLSLNSDYDSAIFQPSTQADSSILLPNFLVLDTLGIMPGMLCVGANRKGNSHYGSTYFYQPSAYTALTQQILMRDWYSATENPPDTAGGPLGYFQNFKYASTVTAMSVSTFPLTYVECTAAQNLTQENVTVQFAHIQSQPVYPLGWVNSTDQTDTRPVDITRLNRTPISHV